MQTLRVNGYDMAYLEVGEGPPLVCVHGSLCDFRIWSAVLGPLSKKHRVISVSLRHFFPEHWDGVGDAYSIAQHVADMIAFIEQLDAGPVDLMGHSRGGHVSFRVAQQRPDLLRRLILAEPGGELDATLDPTAAPGPSPLAARFATAAEKIAAGDIDGGLTFFFDTHRRRRRLGAAAGDAEAAAARQRLHADRPGPRQASALFARPTRKRSGRRRCSSAAAIPRAPARCCARWRRMCRVQTAMIPDPASDVRTGAAEILRDRAGVSGGVSARRSRNRHGGPTGVLTAADQSGAIFEFGIPYSKWTCRMIPLDPLPNLIDQVYARILEAIIDRTLPPGHRIRQNELAEKLGVSRQPVSHALHLLHRQGLVAESGRKGFEVTQLDPRASASSTKSAARSTRWRRGSPPNGSKPTPRGARISKPRCAPGARSTRRRRWPD